MGTAVYSVNLSNFTTLFHNRFGEQFDYVDGYTNCESKISVRCKTCNQLFDVCAQVARKKAKTITCARCVDRERIIKQSVHRLIVLINSRIRTIETIQRREQRFIDKRVPKECCECGARYDDGRNKYCSLQCAKTARNRMKDKRTQKNGKPDHSITLRKLAIRDGMICYICGARVDMSADKNNESYGSIEHVVPVARGGQHQWDNVRLAHRGCNNAKGIKLLSEMVGVQ